MKKYEKLMRQVTSFDEKLLSEDVKSRLETDPEFRKVFEAQRDAANLIALKRYETQSPESAKRIRAGVLRRIRSEQTQQAAAPQSWWSGWKIAVTCLALAVIGLPFMLRPGSDIQPVTSFTATPSNTAVATDESPLQIPEDEFLLASNAAPSLQHAPIEAVPVQFQVP